MMRKRADIDLRKAFAAPPESYIAKTRATLEQLEEEEPVKKFTFSAALALTCALLIMGGALAAGLRGAWNPDNITGQDAQQLSGGQDGFARIAQCVSVDEALFDGRTLYARVTVDLEEWDGTAIVPAPQRYAGMTIDELADSRLSDYDLAVSFRVNGAEQALITGWATAGDATVYEFLYECEPADGALLNVDLSGAFGEGTISVSALNADMNYYSIAQADADGMPELTSGGAVAGEGFACARLYFEGDAQGEELRALAETVWSVGGADGRIATRVLDGGVLLTIMFDGGLPERFELSDGAGAGAAYELSLSGAQALSELTYVDEPAQAALADDDGAGPTPTELGEDWQGPTPTELGEEWQGPTPTELGEEWLGPIPTELGEEWLGPTPTEMDANLFAEGQYDGRGLAHVAITASDADAQLGSAALNTPDGAPARLLAMRAQRGEDSVRYDLLYQCGAGDAANLRASVGGVAFELDIAAGGAMDVRALYADAAEPVGWAVESGGIYFARACLTTDEEAYGALADAQVECVGGEDTNMRAALELGGGAWLNASGYGALPGVLEFMINGEHIALNVAVTADAEYDEYYQFDDGRYLYPGAEDVAADDTADAVPADVQTGQTSGELDVIAAITDDDADNAAATDTGDVAETAALATDELAELQLRLNDSAYDGEYLYVDYELAMPGRYLYDAQLSELSGDADSPYTPTKGAVAVTRALVDAVSGSTELFWSRVERMGEDGGALRYTEVYRCLSAQSMGLYATADDTAANDDSYTAGLELDELEQSDRIRARDVAQVSVPDDIMIMNVNALELDGRLLLGVRYRPSEGDVRTADGINALTLYGTGEASTAHIVDDGAGEPIWCELWELYEAVPEDGEIALQLERAGGEGGEVVLKLLETPELSVVESAREGEYVYALVELTPQDGVRLNYSSLVALQPEAGRQLDLYVTADAELEALLRDELVEGNAGDYIGNETDATTGAIGGADGATSIILTDGPMPTEQTETEDEAGVIGGADGPTSMYTAGEPQPTDSGEATNEAPEVIGGADGPTSIYTADGTTDNVDEAAAATIGIIGGADGPTAIYLSLTGMAVTMPRLTQDGRDITLGVADVTESTEGAEGALRLALVGRVEGEGQLALELRAGGTRLSAGLDLPAPDAETAPGERKEGAGEAVDGAEIELARTVDIGGLRLLEVKLDVTGAGLTGAGSGELMRVDGADIAIFAGDALPERLWFAGAAADARAYSWRAAWQTDAAGEVDYRVYQLLPGDADAAEVEIETVWQKACVTALELAGQLDMTETEQEAQDAQ